MKMVVGLGNPGPQYETTRHNAGFMALDLLADELGINLTRQKPDALTGTGVVEGQRVLLVKPLTFMNLSGRAVSRLARWYGIAPEDILVILDDLDLAPGRLRIRPRGSSGGHKGLASVLEALGTEGVPRARIGIGRPPEGKDVVEYVLEPFTDEEWEVVRPVLIKAAHAARFWLVAGNIEEVMNRYNG
ncbi:MAG: aminoacyl-tRNA hydrolase [Thermanaeromonas sp.]|uniref:aminoacyl-tRNA hydrolase n=1 Tax=Thermanaeromonas sp. TaxID=2003697 RepID=UPI002439E8F2|nr:aminoacyl-tRNA hydrolase [Thermanaeromonas sp.]MCG0277889.1 aminoacyl-tRNA hydrolase [Thermanaeromonas sp.]